jgi:DUF1009 family protein
MPTKAIDSGPVGVLAGEGALPPQLIQYCIDNNIPIAAVQFGMCNYETFPSCPILKTRIERVGEIFSFLRKYHVHNVVMIGNLQRPSIKSLRPDMKGLKTLGRIAGAFMKGDDNLLRSLRTEIENEGFTVRGIDYYLIDLVCDAGHHTTCHNTMNVGDAIQEALRYGADDKGQSILLHDEGTYSYETRDGTTALINDEGREGSILIKIVKPQQDPDLDRPTVGLQTLQVLSANGCTGMVIQANGVLMVDKHDMIAYANDHHLFIEAVNV